MYTLTKIELRKFHHPDLDFRAHNGKYMIITEETSDDPRDPTVYRMSNLFGHTQLTELKDKIIKSWTEKFLGYMKIRLPLTIPTRIEWNREWSTQIASLS